MISVLYVDDEPDLLQIARLFLERTGRFRVDICTSAREAQGKIGTGSYDAIVSDYQMPEIDGIAFLQFVREKYGSLPFILFTGKGREEVVIKALESGADFYIQKGGEPRSQFAELANKIEKAVREQKTLESRKDTEQRLTDIISFLPDATLAIDRNGRVIAWNHAMEQLSGYKAEDMLGKGGYEHAIPFYGEKRPILLDLVVNPGLEISHHYEGIVREGNRLISEKFLERLNGGKGAYIWFIAAPLYDSHGTIVGAVESIRDITAQKRLETSLRASERRYHNVFESSGEAMLVADRDSLQVLDANREATRLYGYTRDELRGMRLSDLADKTAPFSLPSGEGVFHNNDLLQKAKGGRTFPVEITGSIYPQQKRTIVILSARDITGLREAEGELKKRNLELQSLNEKLLASEDQFRHISDVMSDFAFSCVEGPCGGYSIDWMTGAVGEITGYTIDEVKGFGCWRPLVLPDDQPVFDQEVTGLAPKTSGDCELRIGHKQGMTRWLHCQTECVRDPSGALRLYGGCRDITGKKDMDEALRENEARLQALFRNASDIIRILGKDGLITYDSPSSEHILGYPQGFFTGKSPLEFIHPGDRERVRREMQEVYDRVNPGTPSEFRIRHADGHYIWVESEAVNLTEVPEIAGVVVTTRPITERKRAKAALEESEERYRRLLSQAGIGLGYWTLDGRALFFNDEAAHRCGGKPEDFVGKSLVEMFGPSAGACYLERITTAAGTADTVEYEDKVTLPVGEKWYLSIFSRVMGKDGRVSGVQILSHDITTRKTAEEALQKKHEELVAAYEQMAASEEELRHNYDELGKSNRRLAVSEVRFRRLFETMAEGFAYHEVRRGRDGRIYEYRILNVNPAFEKLVTLAKADVVGKTSCEAYGVTEPPFLQKYAEVVESDTPALFESYFPLMDRYFRISAYKTGKDRFATIFQDITESKKQALQLQTKHEALEVSYEKLSDVEEELRKNYDELMKSQKALAEREKEFDNVVDTLQDGLLRADTEGRLVRANPSAARMFGYASAREMTGIEVSCLYAADTRPDLIRDLERDGRVNDWVTEGRRKDGSTLWISVNAQFIRDTEGRVIGTEGILRDISGRKAAEEALVEANQKLGLMNSVTRHDIRNQIIIMRGYLEAVISGAIPPTDAGKALRKVDQTARRIDTLIGFTKDYQEIGGAAPTYVDVRDLVSDSFADLDRSQITLENEVPEGFSVYADPLIKKAFFNLVENAIRHGGPGLSTIRFHVRPDGENLVVICEDDGQGVPEKDKARIFEKGYGTNTGYGLFLSREILSITGISLTEEGTSGKGARFVITVPPGKFRTPSEKT